MKDTIKDRLIHLATAQEFMADVGDKMAKWDESQLVMEKSAFESLNVSDDLLNMSRECSALIGRLLEFCPTLVKNPGALEQKKMLAILSDIHEIFNKINEVSANINNISHQIEGQVTVQKELEEGIKKSLKVLSESIDTAAACAELMMADF